jgi:hypothetical protein
MKINDNVLTYYNYHVLFLCGGFDVRCEAPFMFTLDIARLGGGRDTEIPLPLPFPVACVLTLPGGGPGGGGGGGGAMLCRAGEGLAGGEGAEYDSASEMARMRTGGAGGAGVAAAGVLRAGGGGTALAGDDPALAGLAGGGGGGALPGVIGGPTLRLGGAGGCELLRGGKPGTGRVTTEGVGRAGRVGVSRRG